MLVSSPSRQLERFWQVNSRYKQKCQSYFSEVKKKNNNLLNVYKMYNKQGCNIGCYEYDGELFVVLHVWLEPDNEYMEAFHRKRQWSEEREMQFLRSCEWRMMVQKNCKEKSYVIAKDDFLGLYSICCFRYKIHF